MKPKNDAAPGRLTDRLIGFIAFPIVNFILLILVALNTDPKLSSISATLPWVVNILFIGAAFIRRPQIAMGYIAFPVLLFVLGLGFCGCLIGSCVAILVWAGSSQAIGGGSPVFAVALGVLFLVGIIIIGLVNSASARRLIAGWLDNIRYWFSQ